MQFKSSTRKNFSKSKFQSLTRQTFYLTAVQDLTRNLQLVILI